MKLRFLLCLFFIYTISIAQKKEKKEGIYTYKLINVETPKSIKKFELNSETLDYKDSIISIKWVATKTRLNFDLTNNIDQTLKIIWDDAAFIFPNSESSRVFHKDVKYIDRGNPQPPTLIYKNSTISDVIIPTNLVWFSSGQYGGWRHKPIINFPEPILSKKVVYAPEFLGLKVRVILPIKIEDVTSEYTFTFETIFIENSN